MSGGDGPVSSGAEPVSGAAYLIVFVPRTRPQVGPGAGGLERGAGRASGPRAGRRCRLTVRVWAEVRVFSPLAGRPSRRRSDGIEGGGAAASSSSMSGGDGSASSGAEPVSGAAYLIVFVRRTRPHVGPGAGGSNVAPGGRAAHERVGDAG